MPDITTPVNINSFSTIISNNPHSKSKDWNLSCYKNLKEHIKEHYSIIQEDKCFYCKINLRHGGYGEPIEHIVPKSDKLDWMFEPKNLALSCYACNTKKNAKNTLSNNAITMVNYPSNPTDFIIYHPHFDIWNNELEIIYDFFIRAKTTKGEKTMEVCDLYRFNLPLDKAKQKDWKEEPFKIRVIEKILLDTSIDPDIIEQCKKIIDEIIHRSKIRNKLSKK